MMVINILIYLYILCIYIYSDMNIINDIYIYSDMNIINYIYRYVTFSQIIINSQSVALAALDD